MSQPKDYGAFPYHHDGCILRFTKQAIFCEECEGGTSQMTMFDEPTECQLFEKMREEIADLKSELYTKDLIIKFYQEECKRQGDMIKENFDTIRFLLAKESGGQ